MKPALSSPCGFLSTLLCLALCSHASAADGDPDPTFGNGGAIADVFPDTLSYLGAKALCPDGRILVAVTFGPDFDHETLLRYRADGTRDTDFGINGMTTFKVPGLEQYATRILVQPDNSLIVAGYSTAIFTGQSIPYITRLTKEGWIDHAFGNDGVAVPFVGDSEGPTFGSAFAAGLLRQDDGKLVMLISCQDVGIVLVRCLPDGTVDQTFGSGGTVVTSLGPFGGGCEDMALLRDGGYIVSGYEVTEQWGQDIMMVARYSADGSLDSAFAGGGITLVPDPAGGSDAGNAIAVDALGRIAVASRTLLGGGMVVRLQPDGTPDPSFGTGGIATWIPEFATFGYFTQIACLADGGVLVSGGESLQEPGDRFPTDHALLVRFTAGGSPDTTFNGSGAVMTNTSSAPAGSPVAGFFSDMLVQPDGKIIGISPGGTIDPPTSAIDMFRYQSGTAPFLDLIAHALTQSTVDLAWTAPAASAGGAVASYQVRYARAPISEATWSSAMQVAAPPTPQAPGLTEHLTVTGLASGVTWYFAYRSVDASGLASSLSHVAGATTLPSDQTAPSLAITPTGLDPAGRLSFALAFSERVTGLTLDRITLGNAASATLSGAGALWSLAVLPASAGVVTVSVPRGAATDAAGNGSAPANAQATFAPRPPTQPGLLEPGLAYQYFEGTWNALPDFTTLTPVAVGVAPRIDLGPARRPTLFGLRFTGYLTVPVDGGYDFYVLSDDGSRLMIDGIELAGADGRHAALETSGGALLSAGTHTLTVDYFQCGGGKALSVSYDGPGLAKHPIPDAALSHDRGSVHGILREYWTGIVGRTVATLTSVPAYPLSPSGRSIEAAFVAPSNWADNYGTRMRGNVYPPVTGDYMFWIAGDDRCELWLSTTALEDDKALIATVPSATLPQAWDTWPQQRSAPVHLIAGNTYYIEALQKEAGGGDCLAVGWEIPGGVLERPIPGIRLAPPLSGLACGPAGSASSVRLAERTSTAKPTSRSSGNQVWPRLGR